ncbi:MAG: hypothetical protein ACE3JP_16435 [Ectobacillus sp.]
MLQKNNLLDYHLNMKYLVYESAILDIIIPLVMIIAYCGLFQMLQRARGFMLLYAINKRGTAVMYLHIGINKLLMEVFGYGNVMYVLLGAGGSLLISIFVLERGTGMLRSLKQAYSSIQAGERHVVLLKKTWSGKSIKAG